MHKGKKHKDMSVMDAYNDFARSEGAEAKKYVDSIRKNDPFAKGVDDMMDEESRRRERGYYVKGTVISKGKKVDTPDDGMSRKSRIGGFTLPHQGMARIQQENERTGDETIVPLTAQEQFDKAEAALSAFEDSRDGRRIQHLLERGINVKERDSLMKIGKPFNDAYDIASENLYPSPIGMSRMSSPLNKGRCWDGYKPNPDGRPKSEPGSCVKE